LAELVFLRLGALDNFNATLRNSQLLTVHEPSTLNSRKLITANDNLATEAPANTVRYPAPSRLHHPYPYSAHADKAIREARSAKPAAVTTRQ
jgi:hypothetical protein